MTTRLSLLVTVAILLAATASGAEPAATRLLTASDLANLSGSLELPRAGDYTVKVCAPYDAGWTLKVDGRTLTLIPSQLGNRTFETWQTIGRFTFDPKTPPTLKVASLAKPASPSTKESKPTPPAPVPAILAFTTDPAADLGPALDLVRGELGMPYRAPAEGRTASRTRNEGANFTPPYGRQVWLDRAEHVRTQIKVSLGLWPMLPKTDLRPQVFGKIDRDGYTIEKVVLETLPGFNLSGNLYRPKGKAGRLPLVLCPHGHWADGRMNPEVQARCIWWAKRLGCVVFMYDMVGYNDSKEFGHAFLNDRLRRWGLGLMTLQTWNSIRALDWAVTLPDVDPARVGCTGESGGGTQTFILAALDGRIKVAAPVVMVSHKMQGGCVCENAAGLRIGTDNVEIAALTAPRPMKIVGANDWTDETMTVEYPALQKVYRLLGSPDRISADKFEFEHNYNQTTRNAVYAFMGRWLVGIEDPATIREGEVKAEPADALLTFSKDHPAPPDRKSPAQLETELVDVMTRSLDRLAPTIVAATWEASANLLRTALEVRVGLTEPAERELGPRLIRRANRFGLAIEHWLVSRDSIEVWRVTRKSEWVDDVPVVRLIPAKPTGRATLIASPRGKADLLGPDGGPSPLVKALLDRGQTVIGFDPLFVGESIAPRAPATSRPVVDHFPTYNPTPRRRPRAGPGHRARLVQARGNEIREVSLIALGDSGPLALLARPLLTGIARTAIDLNGFDYGDGSTPVPPALDLPGVLGFGGLKAAAALTVPCPALDLTRAPARFAACLADQGVFACRCVRNDSDRGAGRRSFGAGEVGSTRASDS